LVDGLESSSASVVHIAHIYIYIDTFILSKQHSTLFFFNLQGMPRWCAAGLRSWATSVYCLYFGISLQQYADDTQLYTAVSAKVDTLDSCFQSLHFWLCHNGFALTL